MRDLCSLAPGDLSVRTDAETLPEVPHDVVDRFSLALPRARRSLELGLSTTEPGFHVFIAAHHELGLEDDVLHVMTRLASQRPAAPDVLYVTDPLAPFEPVPLLLPAGQGRKLAEFVEGFVAKLTGRLGAVARTEAFREQDRQRAKKLSRKTRETITGLEERAKSMGFGVRTVPGGMQTYPILHGKPVTPEQFEALDEGTRRRLSDAEEELSTAVETAAAQLTLVTEEDQNDRDEAFARAAEALAQEELVHAREAFPELPEVVRYLELLGDELAKSWREFVDAPPPGAGGAPEGSTRGASRWGVNVVVAGELQPAGAPVVYEPDPTPARLFGVIERRAEQGTLVTDISMLRAGSLLRASGGYLLVRAIDLLQDAALWDALKKALRKEEVTLVDAADTMGAFASSLRPLPVPLHTRVVLVGSEDLYSALADEDPDFTSLFRVKVEVDATLPRTRENMVGLDGFLMTLAKERHWLPFQRQARARLIDVATRVSGDRERLSLALAPLEETAAFASEAARLRGDEMVSEKDVDDAWEDRLDRNSSAARHVREQVLDGEIFLDTQGDRVGVVNGLAVVGSGDVSFGQPMRITAVVSLGNEGVIDVEREAHLGGSIHTKGVAILRGFLALLFGQERPLSLRAQIVFEQSYGEIDGDSASSSELFAILSALADVGIHQTLAVTGSVNQLGEMQPIGGVCAKVEAFYDLCVAKGLDGSHGVLIPIANARHLVLRDDVAQAVAQAKFHLYAVRDVWEGMEVLTGISAGRRDESGRFPADSVFGRVERRIIELAERLRRAEGGGHHDGLHEARESMGESHDEPVEYRTYRTTR